MLLCCARKIATKFCAKCLNGKTQNFVSDDSQNY